MSQNQETENFQLRNWELVSINPNNRNWVWSDYFNFWAVSIQSVIGFSLIASLYLIYDLNSLIVFSRCSCSNPECISEALIPDLLSVFLISRTLFILDAKINT